MLLGHRMAAATTRQQAAAADGPPYTYSYGSRVYEYFSVQRKVGIQRNKTLHLYEYMLNDARQAGMLAVLDSRSAAHSTAVTTVQVGKQDPHKRGQVPHALDAVAWVWVWSRLSRQLRPAPCPLFAGAPAIRFLANLFILPVIFVLQFFSAKPQLAATMTA